MRLKLLLYALPAVSTASFGMHGLLSIPGINTVLMHHHLKIFNVAGKRSCRHAQKSEFCVTYLLLPETEIRFNLPHS